MYILFILPKERKMRMFLISNDTKPMGYRELLKEHFLLQRTPSVNVIAKSVLMLFQHS